MLDGKCKSAVQLLHFVTCMHSGVVLGTGCLGPHFFVTCGGRHEHLKKYLYIYYHYYLGRKAVFYLSYHCLGNWQLGAPCNCRRPCLLRRCSAQIMCEKGVGEGARGTVHLWVSQMELVMLKFSPAKVIN